jgi:structure-specific recognition protein 1
MVDDKLAFELPYSDIAQSVVQGKNEVSFEFHQDDTVQPDEDCLVEMRLYIPPNYKGASNDDEAILDLEQTSAKSAVELFQNDILDRAQLGEKDESIASFEDVLFLTPRGRYDLEVYGTYFKLHGKSYSYKILHKSVNRLFILPRPGGQTTLVISLDPAIRQGNTTHPFLQLSFKDEDEIELKPNLPEDVLVKKYEGKLAPVMTGTYFEILGSVLSAFTNRKINGTGAFETAYGDKCIKCSHKANDGFLFPLEKSFFFIHKPPVYIRHEEVSSVEFLRIIQTSGTASRTFDVLLNLRNSEHLSFTGMNREEFKNVYEYMQSKNLRILNAEELVRFFFASIAILTLFLEL